MLSTIFGNPSRQSFMKVNTARSTNVAKLSKFANMKHLGFFSECFTQLFHSIFGQLFWSFVFSFSSHRSVLHYIGRDPFNQNSNRSDREKRTTSKGGPVFSKLFRLDRTDPLSFGPKFPEILVEWIAPIISRKNIGGIASRCSCELIG